MSGSWLTSSPKGSEVARYAHKKTRTHPAGYGDFVGSGMLQLLCEIAIMPFNNKSEQTVPVALMAFQVEHQYRNMSYVLGFPENERLK